MNAVIGAGDLVKRFQRHGNGIGGESQRQRFLFFLEGLHIDGLAGHIKVIHVFLIEFAPVFAIDVYHEPARKIISLVGPRVIGEPYIQRFPIRRFCDGFIVVQAPSIANHGAAIGGDRINTLVIRGDGDIALSIGHDKLIVLNGDPFGGFPIIQAEARLRVGVKMHRAAYISAGDRPLVLIVIGIRRAFVFVISESDAARAAGNSQFFAVAVPYDRDVLAGEGNSTVAVIVLTVVFCKNARKVCIPLPPDRDRIGIQHTRDGDAGIVEQLHVRVFRIQGGKGRAAGQLERGVLMIAVYPAAVCSDRAAADRQLACPVIEVEADAAVAIAVRGLCGADRAAQNGNVGVFDQTDRLVVAVLRNGSACYFQCGPTIRTRACQIDRRGAGGGDGAASDRANPFV